jgi:hypothetical protein
MKAKDLRIGNLVFSNLTGKEFQVTAADILNISQDTSVVEPITLTEEWLVKFGFKKSKAIPKEKFCYLFEDKAETPIEFYVVGKGFNDVYTIYDPINHSNQLNFITDNRGLNFVHQLQNLYFTVAGTELIIKSTHLNKRAI